MKRLTIVLMLFVLIAGGCYDNQSKPSSKEFQESADCTIAELRTFCKNGCYTITSDVVCIGRIASSDIEGNFYRSVTIEDESGGVEIKLGTYNIATQYPIGLLVALHLNGTAIMVENGVIQVGLPPLNYDSAPREMESQIIIDRHIVRSNSIESITPLTCEIEALDMSLCGRFIRIEGVQHAPLSKDNGEALMESFHRFVDKEGYALFTYISPYSDFADLELTTSDIAIQGILYHETVGMGIGEQFVIKPRFTDDISTHDDTI